jgi:hypothetical protein
VELPFAALKYRIFGHPRFLLRGLAGAQTEISLATLVYNLKKNAKYPGWNTAPIGACFLRELSQVGFDPNARINLKQRFRASNILRVVS